MSDNEHYDYTQLMRRRIIESYIKEGKMPEDPKEARVVLAALDGIDKQELGKARIGIDEKKNQNESAIAEAMWAQLNTATQSPFTRPVEGSIPQDSDKLPVYDHVPGIMDQGIQHENYKDFSNRFEDLDEEDVPQKEPDE